MLSSSRQLAIVEIVDRDGGAQIQQLAAVLGVSRGTIRRDLGILAAAGLVARVHGGAVPQHPTDRAPVGHSPLSALRASRTAIAAAAAHMVDSGATVALPAGPISEMLARLLVTTSNLTAVTYSLPVAQAFRTHQRTGQRLMLTGGEVGETQILHGSMAVRTVQSLHIDVGFVEFDGFGPGGRPANTAAGTAELNRAVQAVAGQVVYYADHLAWDRVAMHQIAPPGTGAVLLLDPQVAADAQRQLAESGFRTVAAYDSNRAGPPTSAGSREQSSAGRG